MLFIIFQLTLEGYFRVYWLFQKEKKIIWNLAIPFLTLLKFEEKLKEYNMILLFLKYIILHMVYHIRLYMFVYIYR